VRLFSWSLVVLVGAVSLACGGQVDPGGDGGTSSSGSSTSSSGGATGSGSSGGGSSSSTNVPPCPSEPPTPGMKCVPPQGCAYFDNEGCEAFLCGDSSVWQTTTHGC
jgi:hypothetical protein